MTFPKSPENAPSHIICHDCNGNGWGPMLTAKLWQSIVQDNHLGYFLCEKCMVVRLGRNLKSEDLRNCPMNVYHPLYDEEKCPHDYLEERSQ